jgi:hypothetical protein
MTLAPLRRYFRLPADVTTVDFVHQIDRAASAELIERVLTDYEVTPSIAQKLDRALQNVHRGLTADRRSVFTWIHGSFGCGKSHFMNVLSLLLADEKAVYAVHPELQAQRARFAPAVIGKKLFRLHVQCISRQARTLEEIVFGAATQELARLHPGAPAPALFESQKLFASARALLADLGDAKFFGAFPSSRGAGEDDGAWGDLGGELWNRARFDAATAAPDAADARKLAGELAGTPWLSGMAAGAEFVKLGPGLQILAEHLKGLGYEGVVLFLDELVLWLSTFQDPKKLAEEAPKVSSLVEHGDYPPVLPFLTFAARQRDLSQMVGKLAVGHDEVVFRDHLSFWKDRFEIIELEDKDLPRIIEKRVLKAASPEAKAEIVAAFTSYKASFAMDFRQLNGDQGDADDFQRVYPFSPALVEVMVALSATLQRERTALRELTHLLVRYLPDFELGTVVPVGDLFDVVAHGQTSDLPAIQRLYEQARRIYENDLLPHIRKKNRTDTPERCQLLREDFDRRLGCAGCAEKPCRTQTRIAKTVLLQGLVPNTPVLKNLTASSLVYLNSGTLKSRVPNQGTAMAAALVKEWAGVTPAVHVKGDANPEVRGVLDTVDVRRILDHCRDLGNEQRRRMRVRQILFEKMGIALKDQAGSRAVEWRGRKWRVGVVYENTRLANDNVFRPGEDEDLRVVLDYPFDDVGHGPREDEARIAQMIEGLAGKEAERGLATLVWLPAFIDDETLEALSDLVTLDGLVELKEGDLAKRVPWVSMDELSRVHSTLEQQRELKLAQVVNTLASAYGVSHTEDARLSPGLSPSRSVHLLRRDARLSVPADGIFGQALESVLKQALSTRAPRHPEFTRQPTKARLETVLELLDRVLDTVERKAKLDRGQIEELRAIAAAEHLGIVRIIEDEATWAGGLLDQVARNLANHKGPLGVGHVRAALDPDGLMELSREVEDFLVLAYARSAVRPLRLLAHGTAVEGLVGKLADDLSLVPVDLPGQEVWQRALATAELLGVAPGGQALTPARLDELAAGARKAALALGAKRVAEALEELAAWQGLVGVTTPVETTQRGEVLAKIRDLVGAVPATGSAKEVAEALGRVPAEPSRVTAITWMTGSSRIEALLETLRTQNLEAQIEAGRRLEADPAQAAVVGPIMDRVRAALVRDENVQPLRALLEQEARGITRILVSLRPVAAPPPVVAPVAVASPVAVAPPAVAPVPPLAAPPEAPAHFVTARVAARLASKTEEQTLRSAADVEALAQTLRAQLGPGKRIHVTFEILDGEEA